MSMQPITPTGGAFPADVLRHAAEALPATIPATAGSSPGPAVAPSAPAAPTGQGEHSMNGLAVDITQVQSALDEVRKVLTPVAQDLRFSIDDDTGRTIIKVIDSSTEEVIRQIPSEEILAIAKALDKLQGLLIKQEA